MFGAKSATAARAGVDEEEGNPMTDLGAPVDGANDQVRPALGSVDAGVQTDPEENAGAPRDESTSMDGPNDQAPPSLEGVYIVVNSLAERLSYSRRLLADTNDRLGTLMEQIPPT